MTPPNHLTASDFVMRLFYIKNRRAHKDSAKGLGWRTQAVRPERLWKRIEGGADGRARASCGVEIETPKATKKSLVVLGSKRRHVSHSSWAWSWVNPTSGGWASKFPVTGLSHFSNLWVPSCTQALTVCPVEAMVLKHRVVTNRPVYYRLCLYSTLYWAITSHNPPIKLYFIKLVNSIYHIFYLPKYHLL